MTSAVLEKKLNPFKETAKNRLLSYLLTNFPAAPITSAASHRRYLKAVEILMETLEAGELHGDDRVAAERFLAIIAPIISSFESRSVSVGKPDPIDMLRFLMEQHKLTQVDLAGDLGGQSVASEILSGKRKLNVNQIAKLSRRFKISPASFIPAP